MYPYTLTSIHHLRMGCIPYVTILLMCFHTAKQILTSSSPELGFLLKNVLVNADGGIRCAVRIMQVNVKHADYTCQCDILMRTQYYLLSLWWWKLVCQSVSYPSLALFVFDHFNTNRSSNHACVLCLSSVRRWDKLEQFISISANADAAVAGDFKVCLFVPVYCLFLFLIWNENFLCVSAVLWYLPSIWFVVRLYNVLSNDQTCDGYAICHTN